jgi:predicted dehydrogenase
VKGIGRMHTRMFHAHEDFEVVAVVDLEEKYAQDAAAGAPGAIAFTDYAKMLAEVKPDVVVVATPNASHAALTIQAAEAGVRGVYCEKPMAINMADGRRMVEVCAQRGVALAVNHQRRTLPVFRTMRRLMEEGAIGRVELIRASCAGDILSDGTHLIDTSRFLANDADVKWVFGQVYREEASANPQRYGHAVEDGGYALAEFETGLRVEFHTGTMQVKGRQYQDFEILGTEGRMWRPGDQTQPQLLLQDTTGGWRQVPLDDIHLEDGPESSRVQNYRAFARMVTEGGPHPLSGESGLKDLEIALAIYESSRLRQKIQLPLQQDRYPLDIMIEQGQM